MMPNGVVKFVDLETGAHFRSQDFTIIKYAACQSWQAYMGLPTKLPRAALPHPGDSKLIADMRSIDIAEIGSNSRKQAEHEDMTFTADAEPLVKDQAAAQEPAIDINTDGQSGGMFYHTFVPKNHDGASLPHLPQLCRMFCAELLL